MMDNLFNDRFKLTIFAMPDPPMDDPAEDDEEDKTTEPTSDNQ